jgi:NAD(P)-dependent dehydrogenase (short-subunit alcohol dehydrogenase family)/acyl dehydratase
MIDDSRTIRFTDQDLLLFSAASGDKNPLHLSREYAARTSYGQQVVFGAFGAVAALGKVSPEESSRVLAMQIDFLRPMFLGVDYRVRVTPQQNGLLARLFDGTSTVVAVALTLGEQRLDVAATGMLAAGEFAQAEAISRKESELQPGLRVSGRYATAQKARMEICRKWQVTVPAPLMDMLLWSSYLIGMELPGKTALFSRLTLELTGEPIAADVFEYEMAIEQVDKRLGQLRIRGRLWQNSGTIASVECRAFSRPASPSVDTAAIQAELTPSDALLGKRVLLIGASRGLGAALAAALASQGARVIAVSRNSGSDPTGRIEFVAGDAADARWREELRTRILAEHGGLDLLINNAFPALLPLLLEANTYSRIEEFMSRSIALTAGPLCSFLEDLSNSKGAALLISSTAVEQPVKEWPHYVAAKKAAEALLEVAALQYPNVGFLVVRPEKMLTEMTNTPMGRRNAIAPEHMAVRIVQRIIQGISGWQLLR